MRASTLYYMLILAAVSVCLADSEVPGTYNETLLEELGIYDSHHDDNVFGRIRPNVTCDNKTYDAESFRGAENDTYALAFYLSVDVAVSAAQARNGCLFDVAKVEGSPAYKQLMARIQHDLKGNRSEYYATPYWYCIGCNFDATAYKTYFRRLWKHYHRPSPEERPKVTNPVPIFREMLAALRSATETSLGAKMNASHPWFPGAVPVHIGAPWKLNYTYEHGMRIAMAELGMAIPPGTFGPRAQPPIPWHDHANDERLWGGEEGTAVAFEQARAMVEMREYDPYYVDKFCATTEAEEQMQREEEMRARGVEIPQRGVLDLECVSWKQCLLEFPWSSQTLDDRCWDMYS